MRWILGLNEPKNGVNPVKNSFLLQFPEIRQKTDKTGDLSREAGQKETAATRRLPETDCRCWG
jgi:hypothetical protein